MAATEAHTSRLTLAELPGAVGRELGVSEWRRLEQSQIDLFADATWDHQGIHVDPARAASGPFGRTIAHGYLTLSLVAGLIGEVLQVTDRRMSLNYGLDYVRFTAPVPVGSNVRLRAKLAGTEERAGGTLLRLAVEIEVEGSDKPALVAELLTIHYGAGDA
jgi:acyl dehydratase